MSIINFLTSLDASDKLSIIAILVSIFGLFLSSRTEKRSRKLEYERELIRQKELAEQNQITKDSNRISMIPYFHLELEDKIYKKEHSGSKLCILPISLINLGRESATNIRLIPMVKNGGLKDYFKTKGLKDNIHFVHEYLDKQYAISGESVTFCVCCEDHELVYDVYFKIQFNDLIGRTYEQDFCFQYSFIFSKNFSLNHTTSVPVCVKDEDRTDNQTAFN